MRFEKVEIQNYRQYRSLSLEFEKTKDTDLHIVIASNGIGKTNLLNSIEWCLYGEESHLGNSSDSLSIGNLGAIEDARNAGCSEITVEVRIIATDNGKRLVFDRKVTVSSASKMAGRPSFSVYCTELSGDTSILENDEAVEFVNHYLPRKIKQYFFFDGEQLENYFKPGQSTSHIKDSIHEISQINIVSNVKNHLLTQFNEYSKQISKLQPQTADTQKNIDDKSSDIIRLQDNISELTKSNQDAQDRIDELTRNISGMEGISEVDKEYHQVENEIKIQKEKGQHFQSELIKITREHYIWLMLYEINTNTSKYILEKENRGVLPPDINKDLIQKSIKGRKCAVCNQPIDDAVAFHLNELIQKFQVSSSVSNKLMEIKNDVYRACEKAKCFEAEIQKCYKSIRENDIKIDQLNKRKDELYVRLSSCSSVGDINSWVAERESLKVLMSENQEKIGSYKKQIEYDESALALYNKRLEEAISDSNQCEEIKLLKNATKYAMDVVKEIADEMNQEMRTVMQDETFSIFSNLIWKKETYARIELNEDYQLRLFHTKGDSCLGSCSAAERELLALAFTLALHKVSHHDSLLFIDTPVGRVSDKNREYFAISLTEVSKSKQLILAFTPSEYSEEISHQFDYCASSFNRLDSTDELQTYIK